MDSRKATITIEIEGGIDIDFNKILLNEDKSFINNLIEILQKRDPQVSLAQEKVNDKTVFQDSVNNCQIVFKHIKQSIDIVV